MKISTSEIRRALTHGKAINPRVLSAVADVLDQQAEALEKARGELERLATAAVGLLDHVKALKRELRARPRWWMLVPAGAAGLVLGALVGFIFGFGTGGG